MKKTLLFIAATFITVFGFAQTVWNFSEAPFGADGASGGSAAIDFTKNYSYNGLLIGTDGTVLWTGLTTNNKTIDGTSYTYRLQTGGGGSPVAPSKIPTTRYLSINVSGSSVINFGMISSSSSATRTLIIVNEGETVLDSIVNIGGSSALTYTYNYSGAATKLYFYSRSSGLNFYYVSATNVIAGTSNILENKGVSFNGNEVLNNQKVNLDLYNVLGKHVMSSSNNISTANLPKGVYLVKAEGTNGALKINVL